MVSHETLNALDELNAEVERAEKFLKRQPGSRHDSCWIGIDPECPGDETFGVLRYGFPADDSDADEAIHVVWPDGTCERLCDIAMTKRVAIASLVPSLINAALGCESDIAEEAERAAHEIRDALNEVQSND